MVRNTINPNELNNNKIWNETPWTTNNSKKGKSYKPGNPAWSDFLLETFIPNLVSLTPPSPDIEENSDGDIFNFRISG